MKHLLILFFVTSLFFVTVIQARAVSRPAFMAYILQEKVAVKPEDLPEPIKAVVKSDTYAGWQVASAFLITSEDNFQYYEIAMLKGKETSTVNLDKDGNKVDK